MFRRIIHVALFVGAGVATRSSLAETPVFEGPPPWRDCASVYLNTTSTPAPECTPTDRDLTEHTQRPATDNRYAAPPSPVELPPSLASTTPSVADTAVQLAFHQTDDAPLPNDAERRLAPPTDTNARSAKWESRAPATRDLIHRGFPLQSISTTLSALAVVIGCFLICTWLLRRGNRKSMVALPREVVSVLGRVPLATRNVAQLLRVGNKLLLVSITPTGAETLTEVADPAEVDRLVGLCQQTDPDSTTKAFEHVFRQMSTEPTPQSFLGNELSFGSALRGGTVRG